ncbi:hypothetical protein [Streptomyces tirandamycinicus]|uniref:Uncharacterized protein n=1 Tax=Streptomyces tirandamycinicus TaxID=2174846 RepID=A0A2S1T1T7_9ACTN|nr:hypothetical protein [Streptomyces tirandamycinicus]AWI32633.1 hypothetical protein DDW44_30405 [Streptomyces tirandamycinicus]
MTATPALCGAPGRDEEEGIDVTCDLAPHGPDERHHAVLIGPYTREPIGEMWWPNPEPAPPHEVILRLIAEHVTESNNVGGLDVNDLVTDLERAGFTLPEIREDGEPA